MGIGIAMGRRRLTAEQRKAVIELDRANPEARGNAAGHCSGSRDKPAECQPDRAAPGLPWPARSASRIGLAVRREIVLWL